MVDSQAPRIGDLVRSGERSFSFEFFPPRDAAGEEQLWHAIRELEPYRPTFVSVTYGAGGSTRDTTVRVTGRSSTASSTRTPTPGSATSWCSAATRRRGRARRGRPPTAA